MLKSERQGKHMLLHLAYRAIVSFAEGTVASCGDVHHPMAIVVPKRIVMPLAVDRRFGCQVPEHVQVRVLSFRRHFADHTAP